MNFELKEIELKNIEVNKGQIKGLPSNPRKIKKEDLLILINSIKENPEMLELREILVTEIPDKKGKYVVIGGNMRLRALKNLDYETTMAKVIKDATLEQLKAYTIKDNVSGGEWDIDMLEQDWDVDTLKAWGLEELDWNVNNDKEEKIPFCNKGDIFKVGNVTIECNDIDNANLNNELYIIETSPTMIQKLINKLEEKLKTNVIKL